MKFFSRYLAALGKDYNEYREEYDAFVRHLEYLRRLNQLM